MNKITAEHRARRACVYIRQSTPDQVKYNLESKRRQYGLADRARALGCVRELSGRPDPVPSIWISDALDGEGF